MPGVEAQRWFMDARLNFNRQREHYFEGEEPGGSISVSEALEQFLGFVRRQFPIFVFIIAGCLSLGLVHFATSPSRYTSHAMLLIDSSKLQFMQQAQSPVGDVPIDTSQVETQVEILKSEKIGLAVVKDLKLAENPEFTGPGSGLLGRVLQFFTSSGEQSETRATRKALASLLARSSITRIGRTYVLDIGFTSLDPARAAEISNAMGMSDPPVGAASSSASPSLPNSMRLTATVKKAMPGYRPKILPSPWAIA